MQLHPSFARILLITGLILLFATPLFLAGIKLTGKHKKALKEQSNSSNRNYSSTDTKSGVVTIII